MIFLSHNHKDKKIVEPIAITLRDTFGKNMVFYDSWSIQPGDSLIQKMNRGLEDCKHFFLFASENSMTSKMVGLEWHNGLIKALGSNSRFIPVKLDGCTLPAILQERLYIDCNKSTPEIVSRQIIDVIQKKDSFTPVSAKFSNLKVLVKQDSEKMTLECKAQCYMEPISHFLFLINNEENELSFKFRGGMHVNGFNSNIPLSDGSICNGKLMGIERATMPGFSFIVDIIPKSNTQILLKGVMHLKSQEPQKWEMLPIEYI